ncbi:cation-transporting P-type ATPase [Telluria beijingensis]|uniref:cation-transporting P-type ATPase n=1 Tax=Telluria beijingensis TaxID=3068633 RepID=UPI0027953174|nr:cation-transporting P-type ATPase [Massilia sp. REN29]
MDGGSGMRRPHRKPGAPAAGPDIAAIAAMETDAALAALASGATGLPPDEARTRLARHGRNTVAQGRRRGWPASLLTTSARPLPLLLLALAALDLATGQAVGAAERLRALVGIDATRILDGPAIERLDDERLAQAPAHAPSSPGCSRNRRPALSAPSSMMAAWWVFSATASTTVLRSSAPTLASRSIPAPISPANPPT